MPTLEELKESQPEAVAHIQQAFASGRLHHAYVMAGPDAGACNELAEAMAEEILCGKTDDPETCSCRRKFRGGNHPDFIAVRPDEKGRIRIDSIRQMAGRLSLKAIESDYKVVLIENADGMNPAAQNALLKTLEEPPGPACFVLTVRRFRSLLPTVRSRSQRVRLHAPAPEQAAAALVEGGVDEELAPVLAALVGSNVDAALDKVEEGAGSILDTLRQAMSSNARGEVPDIAQDLGETRKRAELTLDLLSVELRNQLAHHVGVSAGRSFGKAIPNLNKGAVLSAIGRLEKLQKEWVFNPNPKLGLESVLLSLKANMRDLELQVS